MQKRKGLEYFAVRLELSGDIPGEASILAIGACVVERPASQFYRMLKPLEGPGRRTREGAVDPAVGMRIFTDWATVVAQGKKLIIPQLYVAEEGLLEYYCDRYLRERPFGVRELIEEDEDEDLLQGNALEAALQQARAWRKGRKYREATPYL